MVRLTLQCKYRNDFNQVKACREAGLQLTNSACHEAANILHLRIEVWKVSSDLVRPMRKSEWRRKREQEGGGVGVAGDWAEGSSARILAASAMVSPWLESRCLVVKRPAGWRAFCVPDSIMTGQKSQPTKIISSAVLILNELTNYFSERVLTRYWLRRQRRETSEMG